MPQVPLPDLEDTPIPPGWDYKALIVELRTDLYFAITVFLLIAPFIIQMKPQWADSVQKVEDIATQIKTDLDSKKDFKVASYEQNLQAAWVKDKDIESLNKLKYLYTRTQLETETAKDLDVLYKSFREEEVKLGLTSKLKELRAATRTEWAKEIPEIPPMALTGPLKARIVAFLDKTNKVLDGR